MASGMASGNGEWGRGGGRTGGLGGGNSCVPTRSGSDSPPEIPCSTEKLKDSGSSLSTKACR